MLSEHNQSFDLYTSFDIDWQLYREHMQRDGNLEIWRDIRPKGKKKKDNFILLLLKLNRSQTTETEHHRAEVLGV